MKRKLLLILMAIVFAGNSFAVTHTIVVSDYTFSPSSLTFQIGDTITWVWSSGTHTTTSTTIPAGATSWNASITSTATTFVYVPTVAGTYNYQCNYHVSMGMVGSFTLNPLDVSMINNSIIGNIYPNPASSMFYLETAQDNKALKVTIAGMTGQVLFSNTYYSKNIQVDISPYPDGLYFIYLGDDKKTSVRKLVVSH